VNSEQQESNSKLPFDFVVLYLSGHAEKFPPACGQTNFVAYIFGGTGGLDNQVMHSHCRASLSAFTFQFLDPRRMLTCFLSQIPSCWTVEVTVSPEMNISYHLYAKQIAVYILNIVICVHAKEFRSWTFQFIQTRWM